jgi:replicative DNA helicase
VSPPAAARAEMAVLGAILIDPEAVATVAGIVAPQDFLGPRLRLIYEAALACHARGVPPDYVTLCTELETRGTMATVGGDWVVTSLINRCPTSLYAEHYARCVAEAAAHRRATALAPPGTPPALPAPQKRWLDL